MERRSFLKKAGAGLGASTLAAPAIIHAQAPQVKWRCASSFPKSLDTIYGGADTVSKRVAVASAGRFQIQLFAAGELVPGLQVADAVKDGTVEMGHTASYYFVGKDPTFAFDTAMPFGLNSRQQTSWMMSGGGLDLMREFFKEYNIVNFPCGNSGVQMAGWYRKEIKSAGDLKGLKMRIAGLAGEVSQKLGVVPQQLPGGDLYPALEKGTIDAAEWIGPYDDEKLGLAKVAKFYYYPAWWEGGTQLSVYVNAKSWADLPKEFQGMLEDACIYAHAEMQAKYDARNPAALKRLVGSGVQLRAYPREVMTAAYEATQAMYAEFAQKNAKFKKVYDPWTKFRDDQLLWFRIAEASFDSFVYSAAAQKAGAAQKK
jgi:TRAP-type mannitol/chloroaromatic compound transport system substrate-binding protein